MLNYSDIFSEMISFLFSLLKVLLLYEYYSLRNVSFSMDKIMSDSIKSQSRLNHGYEVCIGKITALSYESNLLIIAK